MHHFESEICTCVHISVTKWCTVGYGIGALWDFCEIALLRKRVSPEVAVTAYSSVRWFICKENFQFYKGVSIIKSLSYLTGVIAAELRRDLPIWKWHSIGIPYFNNGDKSGNNHHTSSFTRKNIFHHYDDVIMSAIASQTTRLTIVYWSVYSGADQRKHQSSTSLAFVHGIHWWRMNSLHKGPVTLKKMFPFDYAIMTLLHAPLWGNPQVTGRFLSHKASNAASVFLLDVLLNKQFSKRRDFRCSDTSSRSCEVTLMNTSTIPITFPLFLCQRYSPSVVETMTCCRNFAT